MNEVCGKCVYQNWRFEMASPCVNCKHNNESHFKAITETEKVRPHREDLY